MMDSDRTQGLKALGVGGIIMVVLGGVGIVGTLSVLGASAGIAALPFLMLGIAGLLMTLVVAASVEWHAWSVSRASTTSFMHALFEWPVTRKVLAGVLPMALGLVVGAHFGALVPLRAAMLFSPGRMANVLGAWFLWALPGMVVGGVLSTLWEAGSVRGRQGAV